MGKFLQLALMAAQAVVVAQATPPRGRGLWRIAGIASAGVSLVIAAGFLLSAFWLFLTPRIGPIQTALLIAALALIKVSVIVLLLRYWKPAPKVVAPTSPLSQIPWAELAAVFNNNKAPALLAALLAGVVAGANGADRR